MCKFYLPPRQVRRDRADGQPIIVVITKTGREQPDYGRAS